MSEIADRRSRIAVVGPVYPYRAGIAYCTTRLAEELAKTFDVSIVSFKRQYPKRFYPGGDDIDETLRDRTPKDAQFVLDIVNPLTWLRTAMRLRRERPDAVILVWWIWVWALPYLTMLALAASRNESHPAVPQHRRQGTGVVEVGADESRAAPRQRTRRPRRERVAGRGARGRAGGGW